MLPPRRARPPSIIKPRIGVNPDSANWTSLALRRQWLRNRRPDYLPDRAPGQAPLETGACWRDRLASAAVMTSCALELQLARSPYSRTHRRFRPARQTPFAGVRSSVLRMTDLLEPSLQSTTRAWRVGNLVCYQDRHSGPWRARTCTASRYCHRKSALSKRGGQRRGPPCYTNIVRARVG